MIGFFVGFALGWTIAVGIFWVIRDAIDHEKAAAALRALFKRKA